MVSVPPGGGGNRRPWGGGIDMGGGGTFMTQRLCSADSVMYDKPDWWVEYNAWTGIEMSLKDVCPDIYQEATQGWRPLLRISGRQDFKPGCVAVFACYTPVVGGCTGFPVWCILPSMHAVRRDCSSIAHAAPMQCKNVPLVLDIDRCTMFCVIPTNFSPHRRI